MLMGVHLHSPTVFVLRHDTRTWLLGFFSFLIKFIYFELRCLCFKLHAVGWRSVSLTIRRRRDVNGLLVDNRCKAVLLVLGRRLKDLRRRVIDVGESQGSIVLGSIIIGCFRFLLTRMRVSWVDPASCR